MELYYRSLASLEENVETAFTLVTSVKKASLRMQKHIQDFYIFQVRPLKQHPMMDEGRRIVPAQKQHYAAKYHLKDFTTFLKPDYSRKKIM